MKIRTLTLEGFQSYYEAETVDFTSLNLAAIIGPNGSGKTSLLNAIEWALYGRFRGDVVKSVIARGTPRAEVTLTFDLGDATYRITRTRTATDRHEVVVSVADESATTGWRELAEKNPAHADPFIVDLLGMDALTARATWMIAQGDFGTFCELQPSPRRAVLASAFGLDHYAILAARADEKRTETQARLEKASWNLSRLIEQRDAPASTGPHAALADDALAALGERAEKDAEDASATLAAIADTSLEQRLTDAQQALDGHLRAHSQAVREYEKAREQAERLVAVAAAQVARAQQAWDDASAATWEIDDATIAVKDARKRALDAHSIVEKAQEHVPDTLAVVERLTAEQKAVATAGAECAERIGMLETTATKGAGCCFTCGQGLTTDAAQALLASENEKRADLGAQYKALAAKIVAANAAVVAARQGAAGAQDDARIFDEEVRVKEQHLADLQRQANQVDHLHAVLQDAVRSHKDAETTRDQIAAPDPQDERVRVLRAAVTEAEEAVSRARVGAGRREALREERDRARALERAVWAEQEARARHAAEVAALAAPILTAQTEVADVTKDLRAYEALREAFRPTGIPAMILAGVVEELNTEANDILADLASDLGVNVTTQREKARGGVDEKIMVYVVTADGQVDYSTLSGSEKFRVALALRIALSRCIARRTGTPVETIVLDEGWGALDEEYKRAVQDVLVRLSEDFSVYTVSHIEDVKDAFPTVIEVSKVDGTSRALVNHR